jgi:hypothetical protein
MLRRIIFFSLAMGFTTPCLWSQDNLPRQLQACSSKELTALLPPDDPVYAETVELTHDLEEQGYLVRCVLQSKMVRIFEGQLGAALYRTSRGDFEALFLPKPHTFASLRLIEHQTNGEHYLYSFEGIPRSPGTMDCAKHTFFSRRTNRFFVTKDKQLAESLGELLDSN